MLILLPPSESKSSRARGRRWRPESLSWPELTPARLDVVREEEGVRLDAVATLGDEAVPGRSWTGADVPTPPTSTGMELAYVGVFVGLSVACLAALLWRYRRVATA